MQAKLEWLEPTKARLTVQAEQGELDAAKTHVLEHLAGSVKVPGFRQGKAPAAVVEKQIDQATLQAEFLDRAVNDLYVKAAQQQDLRPVAQPAVSITKFVPFTTLEFSAEVEVVGDIKLPDYKRIKLTMAKPEVTAKDVNEVIENLRRRGAAKVAVERAAKRGDEVMIDFAGTDPDSGQPIDGATGEGYPLTLGSGTFIPGFEEELVGAKKGAVKTFTITFPADYGAKALRNRPVSFSVTVHAVNELRPAKLDDDFAAGVGPFKTVAELKADIRKQLKAEREQQARRDYDNQLLQKIAAKTEVAIPPRLIEDEIDRAEEEEKRNLAYQGQTWPEHLAAEGVTADEHRQRQREGAELRVKAGLILGAIADKEQIAVTPEELEIRLMLLRNQYADEAMRAELDKPENRRDIESRLMTEKTLDKLRAYASQA